MWFSAIHQLNWRLLKPEDKGEGAVNTRTFFIGFFLYILTHMAASNAGPFYMDLFWVVLMIDCFAIGIVYRLYYKRSIFYEVGIEEPKEPSPLTETADAGEVLRNKKKALLHLEQAVEQIKLGVAR